MRVRVKKLREGGTWDRINADKFGFIFLSELLQELDPVKLSDSHRLADFYRCRGPDSLARLSDLHDDTIEFIRQLPQVPPGELHDLDIDVLLVSIDDEETAARYLEIIRSPMIDVDVVEPALRVLAYSRKRDVVSACLDLLRRVSGNRRIAFVVVMALQTITGRDDLSTPDDWTNWDGESRTPIR